MLEQCGFTVNDIQSKTVKLFPQTTIYPATNNSLYQLWDQTQEYFNPLTKDLVDVILGLGTLFTMKIHLLDSFSSISTCSTDTVETSQREDKSISWIDRLLGCLIIDSPSAGRYFSIPKFPFD